MDKCNEKMNVENTDTIDSLAYEKDSFTLILLLSDGMDSIPAAALLSPSSCSRPCFGVPVQAPLVPTSGDPVIQGPEEAFYLWAKMGVKTYTL